MSSRKSNKTQKISAAKAGISEISGREIESGRHKSAKSKQRVWYTRIDPFEQVWEQELIPILQREEAIAPITLLEYLQDNYRESSYP